jgi:two-component system response regulator RegA
LRAAFARQGWDVRVAGSVAEGLSSLEPPPHFIILDLGLPDGVGETILRKVRDDHLESRVAVCTGLSDPVRFAAVKGLNPEFLLCKPIDAAVMCRLCDSWHLLG